MTSRAYRVIRKVDETPNTISVYLSSADEGPLPPFNGGQFLSFQIPDVGERAYVLSAFSANPKTYRITVKHRPGDDDAAKSGAAYWRLKAGRGDLVMASGPSGSFHLPAKLDRPLVFITAGAGDHHVEGSDGSRATVLRTGAVFRCRPDGSKLHAFAIGLCNPHGNVAFDLGVNLFAVDGDVAEKSKFAGCRLMHVPDAADLGFRLAPASRTRPDHLRGAVFGELPGKMPPMRMPSSQIGSLGWAATVKPSTMLYEGPEALMPKSRPPQEWTE